ncbi:UDP-N-acetylglucosamine 2-epimerase (non-hydrolyzing) [Flavobacteriaceae bacterium]|nr:UDP-N-acetylglucosamine 2-epimerase (non-hydrolyzing) [Flavobacteriaceae bacterium]
MNKFKILTVVGTRPEIIRLSRVFNALDTSKSIEHYSVHTGQNYDFELNEIFYNDLSIRKPDFFLNAAANSASETIGQILIKIEKILDKIKPDAFLVLGDTNSCLCAIVAKKKKIPIFHMEAGNRCFDYRVPEETNRKIVDHISDINLTYSDIAREYLIREGISPDRIIKTGSPMYEVIRHNMTKIQASTILNDLKLKKQEYFVVSAHREENIEDPKRLKKLIKSLEKIIDIYGYKVIFSTHPRTKNAIKKNKLEINNKINLLKPLCFTDYVNLQLNSLVTLSDSGTISEESSILSFKALNIRESHERPEAMEEGAVPLVGFSSNRIVQAIEHLINSKTETKIVSDYSKSNVSEKVVRIILSYTDYVNKFVWKKEL